MALPRGIRRLFRLGDIRRDAVADVDEELRYHVDRLVEIQSATRYSLPEMALRFVLSIPDISTVIVGADRLAYLEEAVSTSDGEGLNEEILVKLEDMALDDPYLLNPGNWGIP